jgi:hypothetical protein
MTKADEEPRTGSVVLRRSATSSMRHRTYRPERQSKDEVELRKMVAAGESRPTFQVAVETIGNAQAVPPSSGANIGAGGGGESGPVQGP